MLAFWALVWGLERALWGTARDRELRPLFGLVIGTLVAGSLFYHFVEGWRLFDAFYFSVVTLATIGYGDFAPQTMLGKAFTIAYVFVGAGTMAFFFSAIARRAITRALPVVSATADPGPATGDTDVGSPDADQEPGSSGR